MRKAVLVGLSGSLIAGTSALAQDPAPPIGAGIEQIAPQRSATQPEQDVSRIAPEVNQLTRRDQGGLVVTTPRERGEPDLTQLTRDRAGVRLPAPPPGAIDLCSSASAEPPPGLDCDKVLEAVAASAPPETRLLRDPALASSRREGAAETPQLNVDADQVAQRLQ
ncbi:MAG: hypothetical protein DI640_14945, partial [Sphingomonas taxi]